MYASKVIVVGEGRYTSAHRVVAHGLRGDSCTLAVRRTQPTKDLLDIQYERSEARANRLDYNCIFLHCIYHQRIIEDIIILNLN